jgi:dolichyl-phosphate beta-glucosyltransferase
LFRNNDRLKVALEQPFEMKWLFDVEFLARLKSGSDVRRKFFELPLMQWEEVPGSKVKPSAILRSGVQMLGLVLKYRLLERT